MAFRRPFLGLLRVTLVELPISLPNHLPFAQRLHHTAVGAPLQPQGLRFSTVCDMICASLRYRSIGECWLLNPHANWLGQFRLARPEQSSPTPVGARYPSTLGKSMSGTDGTIRQTERSQWPCGIGTKTTVHSHHLFAIRLVAGQSPRRQSG